VVEVEHKFKEFTQKSEIEIATLNSELKVTKEDLQTKIEEKEKLQKDLAVWNYWNPLLINYLGSRETL
jgi:hypothetical protein